MSNNNGYEIIEITSQIALSEEEIKLRMYDDCLMTYKNLSKNCTDAEKERMWEILTSRGDEKLMYGPKPSDENQAS